MKPIINSPIFADSQKNLNDLLTRVREERERFNDLQEQVTTAVFAPCSHSGKKFISNKGNNDLLKSRLKDDPEYRKTEEILKLLSAAEVSIINLKSLLFRSGRI